VPSPTIIQTFPDKSRVETSLSAVYTTHSSIDGKLIYETHAYAMETENIIQWHGTGEHLDYTVGAHG
jgi:hypothetical protein